MYLTTLLTPPPPPRVQFLRIFIGNELEFLKSMGLGTGILYRAGEERF
jgi:hypothetical protein